jgi:magnesium transporter
MQIVKLKKTQWIDIAQPNADDILKIKKDFKLHPLIVEEFSTPTIRPKALEYDEVLYLAIHIPLYDVTTKTSFPAEIDIVLTKNTLITSHDHDIYQLTEFFKSLEVDVAKREIFADKSPAAILYYLIEMLLESCFPKMDHIVHKLEHIEDEIFCGHEKEMVFEISVVKRDILAFRRTLKPQRSVIESLAQRGYKLIEPDLRPYYQDLVGTNIRVWNSLENLKETIESLEETNNSLLSNKLNFTMKVLTIFSAVMLPMTVYSNILAMSAEIPFGHSPYGFWIHMTIMLLISLLTITVFKLKQWI